MGMVKEQAIKEHNQETINIMPDAQGWATTAALFVSNALDQIPREKRDNASALIATALSIAASLGNQMADGDEDAKKAYDWLYKEFAKE